jgi:tRNA pseudouridine38-40 synthase
VINRIFPVSENAHCRFDALGREYHYYLYRQKNPFLQDRAYYFPYFLDIELLRQAAKEILNHTDFTSFSKRNTQVRSFECKIHASEWVQSGDCLVYKIKANRFLRGMVKGLVGTMLQAGRNKITLEEFKAIIEARDCTKADFSVPPDGLFLNKVEFEKFM